MENFAIQLEQQLDNLDELIRNVDRRIRACTVPENQKISVTNHNNGFQYYDVDREGRRTYLRKKNMAMVTAVAQRDYDLAVRKVMEDMRRCIERFLRQYNANAKNHILGTVRTARNGRARLDEFHSINPNKKKYCTKHAHENCACFFVTR